MAHPLHARWQALRWQKASQPGCRVHPVPRGHQPYLQAQAIASRSLQPGPRRRRTTHTGRSSSTTAGPAGCYPVHPGPVAVTLPAPEAIESLARQVAEPSGLEVRGVQLLSHRLPLTVQVFVQRGDGGDVSLDQCAALSAPLGEALEAAALLRGAYVLEISSPGVSEQLASDRDFTSFRGFPVEVVWRSADGPEQRRQGLLLGRDAELVQLNVRGRTVRIPRAEVQLVRLVTPPDEA